MEPPTRLAWSGFRAFSVFRGSSLFEVTAHGHCLVRPRNSSLNLMFQLFSMSAFVPWSRRPVVRSP
jgi:hypothetical protein